MPQSASVAAPSERAGKPGQKEDMERCKEPEKGRQKIWVPV